MIEVVINSSNSSNDNDSNTLGPAQLRAGRPGRCQAARRAAGRPCQRGRLLRPGRRDGAAADRGRGRGGARRGQGWRGLQSGKVGYTV